MTALSVKAEALAIETFFDQAHEFHQPSMWLNRGIVSKSREVPERLTVLKNALIRAGISQSAASDHGIDPILRIHSERYVNFLQTAHSEWISLENAGPEVVANAFPIGKDVGYPRIVTGRAGFHMADLACPIGAGTWVAAYGSAQVAIAAADSVTARGGVSRSYGMCRPPGHHAFADRAAGYCFINNAAVAAQRLLDRGSKKVSILDLDVHHGNGTQDIFYDRGDVQFVSIHGDPVEYYPYFWGYADQIGRNGGEGSTVNFPLPIGTDEKTYLDVLSRAVDAIDAFDPDVIVVSLGLDIFEGDPYATFRISTDGFGKIASRVNALGRATVVVQEGGYICDALGDNLVSYLSG